MHWYLQVLNEHLKEEGEKKRKTVYHPPELSTDVILCRTMGALGLETMDTQDLQLLTLALNRAVLLSACILSANINFILCQGRGRGRGVSLLKKKEPFKQLIKNYRSRLWAAIWGWSRWWHDYVCIFMKMNLAEVWDLAEKGWEPEQRIQYQRL